MDPRILSGMEQKVWAAAFAAAPEVEWQYAWHRAERAVEKYRAALIDYDANRVPDQRA